MEDPNPKVKGRGIYLPKQAGLAVDVGCMEQEAAYLNEMYLPWIRTVRPFVTLKAAMILERKVLCRTGRREG